MADLECRFCKTSFKYSFCDLGMSPLSNAYLKKEHLNSMEQFFPLKVYVCEKCFLVQLPEHQSPEAIFSDYAYFSSFSDAFLAHAKSYVEKMIERFNFNKSSQVVELASNDGYLLQYFKEKNVPVLGVEPAANVAKIAEEKGIPSHVAFFGVQTAKDLVSQDKKADLLLGNNVLAHVPDINDFVGGMKVLLKPDGVITMEFPHLMKLMELNQFDTIYHEHFSYLSFVSVERIFAHHGLTLFDVDEIWTHGGSLRIYARHTEDTEKQVTEKVTELRKREINKGYENLDHYLDYQNKVDKVKRDLLSFLINAREEGKKVVGYGAPAKGNTLLNYCGIRTDFIDYTVDRSPHKQNMFLPGTHIPIMSPEKILETKPAYVVILPWNFKDEIIKQMDEIRTWGGKFVVPIPSLEII